MVKTGKWIARHRVLILLLGILLLVPSVIGMAKTRINYDLLSYLPEHLETVKGQDILVDEYGMGAFSMVVVENMDLKDTQKLEDTFSKIPHVKDVLWYDDVADISLPVEMIPKYVHEWEKGYKIVIGIKTSSKENRMMYWLRSCYYKTIKKLSDVEQIEHFTGSGLYDREFIEVLRNLNDPTPFLRGIVAELGYRRKEIPYEQPRRRAGKTHNNFYRLYDAAMLSVTSYTKAGLRLATIFGSICAVVSMLIAMVYLVMKLIWWDRFPAGMAPMLIGMLFLGSVQLFFIGFLGEYIMSINQRVMKRPLVIEEERINFNEEEKKGGNEA